MPSYVLLEVLVRRWREQPAGKKFLRYPSPAPTPRPGFTNAAFYRLLEIFGVLKSVNSTKDTEPVHYTKLVTEYEKLVQVICQDHLSAAESQVRDPSIKLNLRKYIENECKEILDYRIAAERWHLEIDSRSKDRIVSLGEKLSCRFITALLQDRVR